MKKVDVKKIVVSVKSASEKFESLIKSPKWIIGATKYAARQGQEVRKLLKADVAKIKRFLEKEKNELAKFQKQIPGEVEKIKKFINGQQKELQKMLKNVRATTVKKPKKSSAKTSAPKKRTKKASMAAAT